MSIQWQDLDSLPSMVGLYVRAALRRKVNGSQLPETGLRSSLTLDPKRLAAYRKACGFAENSLLPPTYPHVLAFALQMQLLTADDFPFPLLGLVHLDNRIRVLRPLGGLSRVHACVHVENLQPHSKGATFSLVTEIEDALGPLWTEHSTMLCRSVKLDGEPPAELEPADLPMIELTRWYAARDTGRRYARASGDYNPIHLSTTSASLFGFPQAIAHGMWSLARTLAAMGERVPVANVEIQAHFKKPIRLPSEVLLSASAAGSSGQFRLDGKDGLLHMLGSWSPVA
jgi:acyl dehydratase